MYLQDDTIEQKEANTIKRRTIIDVLETQADLASTKFLVVINVLFSILLLISSFYFTDLYKNIKTHNIYVFLYYLSAVLEILLTACYILLFTNAKKRIFNLKLFKMFKITYIISSIETILSNLFSAKNIISKLFGIIIGIIILVCIVDCISSIVSSYTRNSLYEMSNGFRIFNIVCGVLSCLSSLFLLTCIAEFMFIFLLFITTILTSIICFCIASFIKQYNITINTYSAYNNNIEKNDSKINTWRCPECNTKNDISSNSCKNCYMKRKQ